MIRGFFYKFNRSFKNLKNVIFHVKLLSPTLNPESPGGGGIFIIVLSLGGHFVKQHVDRGGSFPCCFPTNISPAPGSS